ncbi:MAG TPA: MFS transporter, partial [Kribbella sp.]|nr:MFS transporter [Kribbella sp.]
MVTESKRWLALALLCLTGFMIILDASIVLVAIPSIERELTFSIGGVQWVPSGYALMFGGLLLLGGRISDLLGRRRVFITGLLLFAGSSLLCGLAWNGDALVLARGLQGAAAAVLAPSALSIVMTTFPSGPDRNKALGIWGATSGVGGTAGSLIGGPVTDGLGWQWIFFINVPVCLLVVVLAPVLLLDSRGPGRRGFDVAGAVTVTAALIVLVYAVIEAPESPWLQTVLLVLLSAVLFALFVAVEKRSSAPLVPLRLFRSHALVGGNLITISWGLAAFGLNFV